MTPDRIVGAILAGGRSRRFGADKALAAVAGVPMIARVHDTLRRVTRDVVVVTAEERLAEELGVDRVADAEPGLGPLAGIHAALGWARGRGAAGALVLACDTPFVPAALLAELAARGAGGGVGAVVPESGGPLGVEPLCAWYATEALEAVAAALAAGHRSPQRVLDTLRTALLPLAEVRRFGDPALLFLNVNTPADHRRAERLAREEP